MKLPLLTTFAALGLSPISGLFGDVGTSQDKDPADTKKEEMEERDLSVVYAANPVARHSLHLNTYVDYLFWTSGVNDFHYAEVGNNNTYANRTAKSLEHSWSSGFRAGMGYAFSKQGWDLDLGYTYFDNNSHAKKPYPSDGDSLYLTWSNSSNVSDFANVVGGAQKSHWHLDFQQIDFNFGKEFFIGKYYSLRPNAGFRYQWIKDYFTVDNVNTDPTEFNNVMIRNHFHGFGFSIGLDNGFHLGHGITLGAKGGMALVYGRDHIVAKASQSDENALYGYHYTQSVHNLFPEIDVGIDLSWRDTFHNEKWGVEFGVGYEYHVIIDGFTAITMPSSGDVDLFTHEQTNFFMQGLTAKANFYF